MTRQNEVQFAHIYNKQNLQLANKLNLPIPLTKSQEQEVHTIQKPHASFQRTNRIISQKKRSYQHETHRPIHFCNQNFWSQDCPSSLSFPHPSSSSAETGKTWLWLRLPSSLVVSISHHLSFSLVAFSIEIACHIPQKTA